MTRSERLVGRHADATLAKPITMKRTVEFGLLLITARGQSGIVSQICGEVEAERPRSLQASNAFVQR